ncbi:helix-turn-helix domain-containing protein [Albimonas pacifica]|uniref:Transcriptional regulator, AraC family n=1 Tax=Albimonas pacifica TaxID=1114924 RepID=A0A1I3GYI6_9RHOB|nr:AraC family transcriptional regulator [Albimonas pacifica]SFI28499.1 transcriptional regulator, AraC family [Albimonas pacifica]
MLRQSMFAPAERAVASRLLADAEASLERDARRTRECLRRLAALIEAPSDSAQGPGAIARGGLAPWRLRRVEAHVDRRLASPIAVAELAAVAGLSEGHFCRAFKASVGQTPHAFVVSRRIERAQDLMLTTAEPLSQVALQCGLADQAHLTRLFRRHVGATPLAWRRTYRQEH